MLGLITELVRPNSLIVLSDVFISVGIRNNSFQADIYVMKWHFYFKRFNRQSQLWLFVFVDENILLCRNMPVILP